jgi:hypothetical protein
VGDWGEPSNPGFSQTTITFLFSQCHSTSNPVHQDFSPLQ